jgi:Rab proteins geranylgeranyltransferase component A
VYILDRRSEAASSGDKFVVQLHDFPDPLTADVLIAAQDQLPVSLQPSPAHDIPLSSIARCIVVIDKPIPFPPMLSSQEGLGEGEAESSSATSRGEGGQKSESETPSEEPVEATPIDTSVIIFPPNSVNGGSSTEAAQALVTGVGTLSAPQGKCKYT